MTPPTTPTALAPLMRPIAEVRPHPENVRRGDVPRIADSLKRYGQLKPIAALPDGRIVAGNHTFYAATELGWTELAVVTVDLTEDDARRYMLADNRATDMAGYDDEALARLLTSMMEAGQLEGTGYTPDEVDDLIAGIGAVPTTPEEEFTGDYAENEQATSQRWPNPDDHVPMFQAVLLFTREDAERYNALCGTLKKAWGLSDNSRTVLAALESQPPSHGIEALEQALERLVEGEAQEAS